MAFDAGTYEILDASANPVRFFPLDPKATLGKTKPKGTNPAKVKTPAPNAIVVTRTALFDFLIALSSKPLGGKPVTAPSLPQSIQAGNSVAIQSLVAEDARSTRIRIVAAVQIAPGQSSFTGTLQLKIPNRPGALTTISLPISVKLNQRANGFVFGFVNPVTGGIPLGGSYCWTRTRVIDFSSGDPVEDATVVIRLIRDNRNGGISGQAHTSPGLLTNAKGFIAIGARTAIALPINWPVVFRVSSPDAAQRAQMFKLTSADATSATLAAPLALPDIKVVAEGTPLASKRVVLDPGHGVCYASLGHRRSQEWFVTHRVLEKVAKILTGRFGLPTANLSRTRTAGFSIIDPDRLIGNSGAPEVGIGNFVVDLRDRSVMSKVPRMSLVRLSDFLVSQHADSGKKLTVTDADRALLADQAALRLIFDRMDGALASKNERVQREAVTWDPAGKRYTVPTVTTGTPTKVVNPANVVVLVPGDKVILTDALLERVVERAAVWSILSEIGGGAPADTATRRPAFATAAGTAMTTHGARTVMVEACLDEVQLSHPTLAQNLDPRGWDPPARARFFKTRSPRQDLFVSLHVNANPQPRPRKPPLPPLPPVVTGKGMEVVVPATGMLAATANLAKMAFKYIDWFKQGLHAQADGFQFFDATQIKGNPNMDRYCYLEVEFMDSIQEKAPSKYMYEAMVDDANIDLLASQIVGLIVEALLDPQNTAAITLAGRVTGGVW